LESYDTDDQAIQKLKEEVHHLNSQSSFLVVCIMLNHLFIIVYISISLLFFVETPDLSESIDLKSSMNLKDWKLSNNLNSEIYHCISHESILDVPDHGPFLLSLAFLLSLLLLEISGLFLLHF
jgi:hypothetical protein